MRYLLLPLWFACAAPAQTDARAALDLMVKAYSSLRAVHLVATQNETITLGSASGTVNEECEFAVRPGGQYRVRVKQGDDDSIAVSNGMKSWKALPRAKQWSQMEASGAGLDDDEAVESHHKDLRGITQDVFLARYLAMARKAQDPEIIKEENYKLGKEKVPCVVLRLQVNDNDHELWIDRARGFVLQEVQTGHRKTNEGLALVKTTIKLKELEIDNDVEDSAFTFEVQPNWREVEMLVLPGEESPLLKGQQAADFRIKTLEGEQIQLSSLRGKVVVLDFWATWCPPCREELPSIEKLRVEFADQVTFLGVDDEEGSTIKSFLNKHKYELTVLMDQKRAIHRQYGVEAIPTVLIVDKNGVIRSHFIGSRSPEILRSAILDAAR